MKQLLKLVTPNTADVSGEPNSLSLEKVAQIVLGLSTPALVKQAIATQQLDNLYFCSFNFSPDHLIPMRDKKKPMDCVKQFEQYKFISNKLLKWQSESFHEIYIVFEQTKSGMIHFHPIIKMRPEVNIFDVKCELFDMFNIRSKSARKYSFDSKLIDNLDGIIDYLFYKKEKKYEELDQSIYKPIKTFK